MTVEGRNDRSRARRKAVEGDERRTLKRWRRRRQRCTAPIIRDVPKVEGLQARGRLGRHAGAVPDRQEVGRRGSRGRLDRAQARRAP